MGTREVHFLALDDLLLLFLLQFMFDRCEEMTESTYEVIVGHCEVPVEVLQQLAFQSVHLAYGQKTICISGPVLVDWRRVVQSLRSEYQAAEEDSVACRFQAIDV